MNIRSVVIFCRARIVDDAEDDLKRKIAVGLCRKFTDDEAYLQKELTNALPRAACLELTPEHITGKLVDRHDWRRGGNRSLQPQKAAAGPLHAEIPVLPVLCFS